MRAFIVFVEQARRTSVRYVLILTPVSFWFYSILPLISIFHAHFKPVWRHLITIIFDAVFNAFFWIQHFIATNINIQ